MERRERIIPIEPLRAADACSAAEPFALMVLGDSMAPEFREGDVIVVEPDGHAADGAYVVAHVQGDWVLRTLVARDGAWQLAAADPRHPPLRLRDLRDIRGVVIQRSTPGQRSRDKRY